jgi:hypothetical protein
MLAVYQTCFEVYNAIFSRGQKMHTDINVQVALRTSCVNRRFGGTYRLHLQGKKVRDSPAHAGSPLANVQISP